MAKKKSKYKSTCCNASIRLEGTVGDFHDQDKSSTLIAVCTKCNNPCSIKFKVRKTWEINPVTKIKEDERKKFQDKLTKKEIENYRKNEDF